MSSLVGKWVSYHGSIVEAHGDRKVTGEHPSYSGDGSTRYVLDDMLSNVRRESFTVIDLEQPTKVLPPIRNDV